MALPVHRQISDHVIREIASGALPEGARLPPEREMAAAHRVSVGTLRRALASLEKQGLLDRRHGSGNYVRGVRAVGGLYGFFRLERPAGGGLPGADLLSVVRADAPGAAPFAQGHRIRRLRTLDGVAVAAEEIWLDAARAPDVAAGRLAPALYGVYLTEFGLRITEVEDRCGTAPLPDWGAAALSLAVASTVVQVERRSRAQDGAEVEYSLTWFDSEKARYVARLT